MAGTKSLFAPKKGKEATKGQKQIHEENKETIKFYTLMAAGPIIAKLLLSSPSANTTSLILFIISILIQSCAIGGMYHMAKPVVSSTTKALLDGGTDLNLKAGFADYLKDLIITTAICSGLSVISNGFWILWLWLPAFYVYKIWTAIIAPWVFAPAPEPDPEVADKKRKKMERKMARAGYR